MWFKTTRARRETVEYALKAIKQGVDDTEGYHAGLIFNALEAAEKAFPDCPYCAAVEGSVPVDREHIDQACGRHRRIMLQVLEDNEGGD